MIVLTKRDSSVNFILYSWLLMTPLILFSNAVQAEYKYLPYMTTTVNNFPACHELLGHQFFDSPAAAADAAGTNCYNGVNLSGTDVYEYTNATFLKYGSLVNDNPLIQTWKVNAIVTRVNDGSTYEKFAYVETNRFDVIIEEPDTYTIEIVPEIKPLPMIPPAGTGSNQKLNLKAVVKNQDGEILKDTLVELTVEVKPDSGGHEHHSLVRHEKYSGKLSGTSVGLNKVEGVTGSSGYNFTFTPPTVSGSHKVTATCLDVECGIDTLDNIKVGIDNLTSLGAGDWVLIGGKNTNHTDNHYLTATSISRITDIAQQYNARYLGENLYLNDASLVTGGVFDIHYTWAPQHFEHRKGTVIDVRANTNTGAIPIENRDTFERYVRLFSGTADLEQFFDIDTGEELVANRHYHVRLEGRRE